MFSVGAHLCSLGLCPDARHAGVQTLATLSLSMGISRESMTEHLQRSMWTALCCTTPLSAVASCVCIGPTSQVKKAGVMRAFNSAPHFE